MHLRAVAIGAAILVAGAALLAPTPTTATRGVPVDDEEPEDRAAADPAEQDEPGRGGEPGSRSGAGGRDSAGHGGDRPSIGGGGPEPGQDHGPVAFSPCVGGMAGGTFPCQGVDLLSRLTLEDLGLSFANDVWGWTDPRTGRDYALAGGTEGTAVVDVANPMQPWVVGFLPRHSEDPEAAFWNDVKVVRDHMFVVSEQAEFGLQVFDLTQVRDVARQEAPVTFQETAHYGEFGSAHNLVGNEATGFLYAVGAHTGSTASCGGGLHMIDVNDPAQPIFAGCFAEHGYIHDAQCVVYRGPDARYRGREICFNSNAPGAYGSTDHHVSIVDVTDKARPAALARETYPQAGYSHQGWLTEDQRFFLHGDEGDEMHHGLGTTTRAWDVQDLENPELVVRFENDTPAVDHNVYTEGDRAYASNYTSGLRLYDIGGIDGPEPAVTEVGFFDIYPEDDDPTFEGGTWSNYPYFRQPNVVVVSSMDRGLFILRPRWGVG